MITFSGLKGVWQLLGHPGPNEMGILKARVREILRVRETLNMRTP